ncbi:MAG: thioredoxin family protein [Propionivibrio sp.]
MAVSPPICDFGRQAPDFLLDDTDGTTHTRDSLCGESGLLVMFICNHCPYVQAIIDRLCRDVIDIQALGFGVAAVMSNDVDDYPEDAPANMQRIAREKKFSFPYLYDPTQAVARAYGAVCTPDFFVFNRDLQLQYRGRLDASGRAPAPPDARRELVDACRQIAASGFGPHDQIASMGCSIKWRD